MTLLIAMLTSTALAGGLPGVLVAWKNDHGTLFVDVPPGEHIAPDAPASGWIEVDDQHLEVAGSGSAVAKGLGLYVPGRSVRTVQGELRLSLCEDGGTTCRVVDVGFIGTIDGRKGEMHLAVHPPTADPQEGPPDHDAPHLSPDEAFAAATSSGQLVLLDFSAVWCPPCNLLAAEVLHDPDNAGDLAPFVVTEVDVDRRSSWDIKDRYAVGGYPTVVVARADGTEVDRMVGFPGEAGFLAWLEATQSDALPPLGELVAAADSLSPADAATAALRLAQAEREDEARQLLARADDGVEAHMARLMLEPAEAEVAWLAKEGGARIYDWVFHADAVELSEETTALLRSALDRAVPAVTPIQAADLLYMRATLADDAAAPGYYAAAAALLQSALSGDPARDRGHYTFLATLLERAGDPDAALDVLRDATRAWPHEFTFHFAAAGLLQRQGRYTDALPYALAAEALSYGDMRLRAVHRHAELLFALGQDDDARALIAQTLEETERPADDVKVRTGRYLDKLVELNRTHADR
ncbi:MAG: thioredoxin family protein [Alphaproteobacteria bacterium]|nr:thioredoxin family protein [Alphaproteobacteria bacterium]